MATRIRQFALGGWHGKHEETHLIHGTRLIVHIHETADVLEGNDGLTVGGVVGDHGAANGTFVGRDRDRLLSIELLRTPPGLRAFVADGVSARISGSGRCKHSCGDRL